MGRHREHTIGSCAVCMHRATHLVSQPKGPPVWLCAKHFEVFAEMRKGPVRQRVDQLRWWFRRRRLH
jgi:hypothetical protein